MEKKNYLKNNKAICITVISKDYKVPKENELYLLANSANYHCLLDLQYKQTKINSSTYISKGHLENLVQKAEETKAEYLIFDK